MFCVSPFMVILMEYKVPYTESELEQMAQDRKQKRISKSNYNTTTFLLEHVNITKSKIELESLTN